MSRKILVVEFDVTKLSKTALGALELDATAQGEASDGEGGKHYEGETGHPDAPLVSSRVTKPARGQRSLLRVEFDVSGFTKDQIGWLASETEAQAEDYDAKAWSSVVER